MSFDVAAEAYDRFMGRWSQPLAPQLADLAGVRAGQRVLDVGCGPGALTGELVARVGADSVAAADPSEQFAAAARERYPGVEVVVASADDLPFDDDAFDATLAQLVVQFMPDPVAGLTGMARVTRPGGVVAACSWDHVGGRSPLAPFWKAVREVIPSPGGESAQPGTREGHLVELFAAAGLTDVEASEVHSTLELADFDDFWEPFTHGVGPAGTYLARLDDERATAVRERCREEIGDGPRSLTVWAWAARGVVPATASRSA